MERNCSCAPVGTARGMPRPFIKEASKRDAASERCRGNPCAPARPCYHGHGHAQQQPSPTRAPRQDLPPPITPVLSSRARLGSARRLPSPPLPFPHARTPDIPTTHPHGSRDRHRHDDAEPRRQPRREEAARGGGGGHGAPGGRGGGAAAAAAGGVRGAARVPQGQRVHPRPLPRRVAHPRRAPQRLRLAQRDPQRLDASGRVPAVPGARRRRRGEGSCRRRRAGDHEVRGEIGQCFMGQRPFGPAEPRRRDVRVPRRAAVAADGVPGGRHVVPRHQRDGAPAGVPLAARQRGVLAARLRGHLRDDRRLLRAAGVLRLPLPPAGARGVPVRHHGAGRARGGRAAVAVLLVPALPPPPRRAVPRHGPLGRGAGAARAVGQLGPRRVLPGAGPRGRHGARLRHGRLVLRQPRAGEVAARGVRRRGAQPPDLPRARARRRRHALRRRRRADPLEGEGGRRLWRRVVGAPVAGSQQPGASLHHWG